MDTKVNYVAVGLFVLALLTVLIGVFIWLTTLRLSESSTPYVTYMHDEVSGLSPRSAVRYNGVDVGYVVSIDLSPTNPQQVRILMEIKRSAPITTSTVAVLQSEGITGVEYIGLKALKLNAPALKAKPGEDYPVIPSEHSFLVKMSDALQAVSTSVIDLSHEMQQMFGEKNRLAVEKSLQNIETVTHTLATNSQNIDTALKSASEFLKNSSEASVQFPQLMRQVKETLVQIEQSAKSLTRAGSSVANTMDQTHPLIPTAQQLLQRLDGLSGTLQQVAAQLKLNPGALLRGTAPPAPGPGEMP